MKGTGWTWRSRWGLSLPNWPVVRLLGKLVAAHGCPSVLRTDNGPKFTAPPLVCWCAEPGGAIHYIQPDEPGHEDCIERFNRNYRTEALTARLFESISKLRAQTTTWLRIYNQERPHDNVGQVLP